MEINTNIKCKVKNRILKCRMRATFHHKYNKQRSLSHQWSKLLTYFKRGQTLSRMDRIITGEKTCHRWSIVHVNLIQSCVNFA